MRKRSRSPASPIAFTLVLMLLFSLMTPPIAYAGTDPVPFTTMTVNTNDGTP